MATEIERSYLAGMIDADGSVSLRQQKSGSLNLEIMVYNVNEPLMHWLNDRLGGNIRSEKRAKREHWRIRWIWSAGGDSAASTLSEIAKFMIVKQPQAELAIEAWANRRPTDRSQRRWKPVDEDAIRTRRDYVDRMHNLNAVGGNGSKDVFIA